MLKPIVCYKTKEPVYYNKGTQWESTCDHFLLWYMPSSMSVEQVQAICDKLNTERPETFDKMPIPWKEKNIAYLYANAQEEMRD